MRTNNQWLEVVRSRCRISRMLTRSVLPVVILIFTTLVGVAPRGRADVSWLYNLNGRSSAALVQGTNGLLYGTTAQDLFLTYGRVFVAQTNGQSGGLINLHNFTSTDAGQPNAGLTGSPSGLFFGTAAAYGVSNSLFAKGMGSVYSVSPTGTFSVLYHFGSMTNSQGQPLDGATPIANFVLGPDGYLYGTAYNGGSAGYATNGLGFGTVFKLATDGSSFEVMHSFSGADGANPTGMIFGNDGNLYGVTSSGGNTTSNNAAGAGVIFKLSTNGGYEVLYSFGTLTNATGQNLDGTQPNPLMLAKDFNFYGTTAYGGSNSASLSGSNGCGTFFRVTPGGGFSLLYTFGAMTNAFGFALDGCNPAGSLIQGPDDNFYGVTQFGGPTNAGTIFRATADGAFTTLSSFGQIIRLTQATVGQAGINPRAGLLIGADASMYGTTFNGGVVAGNAGAIYRYGPGLPNIAPAPPNRTILAGQPNSYSCSLTSIYPTTVQWQLNGTNLINDGRISGTTTTNLFISAATVADSGTYTLIASNAAGMSNVSGVLTVVAGTITKQPTNATILAGGTNIFTVGVNSVLPFSCQWQHDGITLSDDGRFSGTSTTNLTLTGASLSDTGSYSMILSNSAGFIQSTSAVLTVQPWFVTATPTNQNVIQGKTATLKLTVQSILPITYRWKFNGGDLADGGNISGSTNDTVTIVNSTSNNSGTYSVIASNGAAVQTWIAMLKVFPAVSPGCVASNCHSFTSGDDGAAPNALILASDGAFYSTTHHGGANSTFFDGGTFFKFTTNGALTTLYSFDGVSNEADPIGRLAESNGVFYGTVDKKINGKYGAVFQITTNGVLSEITNLSWTNAAPYGLVRGLDGKLYGSLYSADVYAVDPADGTTTTVHSFGAPGSLHQGLTVGSDGMLYGGTAEALFGMDGAGTVTTLAYADVVVGFLAQAADGSLYGETEVGGTYDRGTIFKFSTNGGLVTLYSFGATTNWDGSSLDGSLPTGGLAWGPDGMLYGTTQNGGYNNDGTVFRISTNGIFDTLVWLNESTGHHPSVGPLVLGPDYNLYGTMFAGGANNAGTIIKIVVPTLPPQISGVVDTNGNITLTTNARIGLKYQLQYSTTLPALNWNDLGPPALATSSSIWFTDQLGESQRFYRIILVANP